MLKDNWNTCLSRDGSKLPQWIRVSVTEGNGGFIKKDIHAGHGQGKGLDTGVRLAGRKKWNEKRSEIKKILVLVECQEPHVSGVLSCWRAEVKFFLKSISLGQIVEVLECDFMKFTFFYVGDENPLCLLFFCRQYF